MQSPLLLLLTVLLACQSNKAPLHGEELYRVTKIIDGDTFYAAAENSNTLKIRLIGIDAPESRPSAGKQVHPFGSKATEYLESLINGQMLRLEFDVDKKDKYGRMLAYAYLEDGTFINAEMVRNGYALVLTIPPNVKFADVFAKFQREARENGRGLWAYE